MVTTYRGQEGSAWMRQDYEQIIHLYRKDYSKKLEQMIQEYEHKVGTGRIAEEIKMERDYMNESTENRSLLSV